MRECFSQALKQDVIQLAVTPNSFKLLRRMDFNAIDVIRMDV